MRLPQRTALALAAACAVSLSSCSITVDTSDPALEKVGATASQVGNEIEQSLTELTGASWDTLRLPTEGPISRKQLESLGIDLPAGSRAYVVDYNSPTDFTVCADANGQGPSVTHRVQPGRDKSSESTKPCPQPR